MEFVLNILKVQEVKEESNQLINLEYLNSLYKDQGLQFDQYGNPIYLSDEREKEITI